jgi:flavin reductase (DIM6/NTAB) family NADH-FMN oxidoreductase RutF
VTEPAHHPTAFDGARFRQVLGRFPTGVVVVTAQDDEAPVGLAIRSFASVSLSTPIISDATAHIACELESITAAGDHDFAIRRDVDLEVNHEGGPLVFYRGGYTRLLL